MNFEMNSDRLLAKRVQLQQETKSGIVLSVETAVDDNRDFVFGRIVAIGEGRQLEGGFIPTKYKVGEYIVYNERVPLKFKFQGDVLDMLRENEVAMRVTGDDIKESDDFSFDFLNKITSERPSTQQLESLK